VIEITSRVDESSHLLGGEYGGQTLVKFRERNMLGEKVATPRFDKEES
jgi:hypothetical protein